MNEEFNIKVKADFLIVKRGKEKYKILNVVDVNTAYGERSIVGSRSSETMMYKFEEIWLCRHGAPLHLSADQELCLHFFIKYLKGHNTSVKDRPARSSHKMEESNEATAYLKPSLRKYQRKKQMPTLIYSLQDHHSSPI